MHRRVALIQLRDSLADAVVSLHCVFLPLAAFLLHVGGYCQAPEPYMRQTFVINKFADDSEWLTMNPLRRVTLSVRRLIYRGERTAARAAHPTTGTTMGTTTTTRTTGTHAPGHWKRKLRRALFWRRRPRTTVTI